MDGSLRVKMLHMSFASKLDWDSYIISFAKTAYKNIGTFICFMKFLSPEFALYLCTSTIRPCMEYCAMSGLVILAATWNCYKNCKTHLNP